LSAVTTGGTLGVVPGDFLSTRCKVLLLFSLGACTDVGDKDATDSGDGTSGASASAETTSDTGTDSADTGVVVQHTATLRGTVIVEPFRLEEGQRVPVDESELAGTSFPYGALFIAAQDAADGQHVGSDTLLFPDFTDNTFEVEVSFDAGSTLRAYAALDDDANAIVSSDEPVGVWPEDLLLADGDVVDDLVIRVLVEFPPDTTEGGHTLPDGTPCDLHIQGDVTVSTGFEGAGLAMLLDPSGHGPHTWTWFMVEDGAATYAMDACPGLGEMQLVGALDTNGNQLIDPTDTTGAYVSAPDVNGNPVTVATADLLHHTIQVPLMGDDGEPEHHGVALVPFVRLTGTLTYDGGTFDALDPGTEVVVAALKYRPNTSVPLATLTSSAFDTHVFDWSELQGNASVDYTLLVPGHTELYLWAYADPDLDGVVNEAGEPVASASNSGDGLVETADTDQVHDMAMGIP